MKRYLKYLLTAFLAIVVSLVVSFVIGPVFAKDKPADPTKQMLGDLACTQDQIAKFDAAQNAWVCAAEETGSRGGLVVYASNGANRVLSLARSTSTTDGELLVLVS